MSNKREEPEEYKGSDRSKDGEIKRLKKEVQRLQVENRTQKKVIERLLQKAAQTRELINGEAFDRLIGLRPKDKRKNGIQPELEAGVSHQDNGNETFVIPKKKKNSKRASRDEELSLQEKEEENSTTPTNSQPSTSSRSNTQPSAEPTVVSRKRKVKPIVAVDDDDDEESDFPTEPLGPDLGRVKLEPEDDDDSRDTLPPPDEVHPTNRSSRRQSDNAKKTVVKQEPLSD